MDMVVKQYFQMTRILHIFNYFKITFYLKIKYVDSKLYNASDSIHANFNLNILINKII